MGLGFVGFWSFAYFLLFSFQSFLLILFSILTKFVLLRNTADTLNSLIWSSNLSLLAGHILGWFIYYHYEWQDDGEFIQPEYLVVFFPMIIGLFGLMIKALLVKRRIAYKTT